MCGCVCVLARVGVPLCAAALGCQNGRMSDVRTPDPGWFSDDDLEDLRRRIPILYVEAVPVRLSAQGAVTEVGLLIRVDEFGEMRSALVSGRVQYGETVRDALLRNIEKDLGPLAFPGFPLRWCRRQWPNIFRSPHG